MEPANSKTTPTDLDCKPACMAATSHTHHGIICLYKHRRRLAGLALVCHHISAPLTCLVPIKCRHCRKVDRHSENFSRRNLCLFTSKLLSAPLDGVITTGSRKWCMACQIAATRVTLSDLQGHSSAASLSKCDSFVQLCCIWWDFDCMARSAFPLR